MKNIKKLFIFTVLILLFSSYSLSANKNNRINQDESMLNKVLYLSSSLYNVQYPCDSVFEIPAGHLAVLALEPSDNSVDLDLYIYADSEHHNLISKSSNRGSQLEIVLLPSKEAEYSVYANIVNVSKSYTRYKYYLKFIDISEKLRKAAIKQGLQEYLTYIFSSKKEPDEKSQYTPFANAGTISNMITSSIFGANLASVMEGGILNELVNKFAKETKSGKIGEVAYGFMVNYFSEIISEIKNYKNASFPKRIRIGIVNCFDSCSIELPVYQNGKYMKHFSSGSVAKAVEDGQIFIPPCDALGEKTCQKFVTMPRQNYEPKIWKHRIGRYAGTNPDLYRQVIEAYNETCRSLSDPIAKVVQRRLARLINPPYEAKFWAYQPTKQNVDNATIGELIHEGQLMRFYPYGISHWTSVSISEYKGPLEEKIFNSLKAIDRKEARILSCYYRDENYINRRGQTVPVMKGYHYWYQTSPISPEQLQGIYPWHPLLQIGKPQIDCPQALVEVFNTKYQYISGDQVKKGVR